MAKDKTAKSGEPGIGEKINEIIQRNRIVFVTGLLIIVLGFIGSITIIAVRERLQVNALAKIDAFERRYSEIGGNDELARALELAALLAELSDFHRRNFGFALARSYNLSAEISWDTKNYAEAERLWLLAAKAARNSYFEPVTFFNAAVAAEEQGNIESAIAHFGKILALPDAFPFAARAQYAIGRLEESRNNAEAAVAAYRNILGRWPSDAQWANLAQSRIIALSD